MVAIYIYPITSSAWPTYITIITFSRGMITMFIYSASIHPSEIKKNKTRWVGVLCLATIIPTTLKTRNTKMNSQIKEFSATIIIAFIATILTVALINITSVTSNPHASLQNSY
jgi:glycerol uptake facilitator-like aquaporin